VGISTVLSTLDRPALKKGVRIVRAVKAAVLTTLTLFGVLGGAIPMAPAAHASVGCYGDYCSGMDPKATGCAADAQTVAWVDLSDGRLDLRWSPTCKTNWARYEQYPYGSFASETPLALYAVQDTGYTQKIDWFEQGVVPEPDTYWTSMIYSPVHKVRAELAMSCGDQTLVGAAFDCAMNGRVQTEAR
jgi:hypothetical protein